MKARTLFTLAAIVGTMAAVLAGVFWGTQLERAFAAPAAPGHHYRVIDENDGEKIERDLNGITRQDPTCRPVLAIAPNQYGKAKVILQCGGA